MRRFMTTFAVACLAATSVSATADPAAARDLTVYSSLPLTGPGRTPSVAIVRGARLALDEAGGMAGGHRIRYVSLNDANRFAGYWTPEDTSANARRAARDGSTIAYLGEFNSGASAISIPILNEVGVPQISPSNTAIGLTRGGLGAYAGEPHKYYPAERRTFFRIVPNDRVQGAALARLMHDRGCRRVAALHDGEAYGRGVAGWARRAAARIGLRVVTFRRAGRAASGHRRLARRLRQRRPDCVVYGGITINGAPSLFQTLARTFRRAQLFGSDGIAESGFTNPREGGVPARVGRRMLLTVATPAPSAYPAAGQDFFRRYGKRYGDRFPDPYAIHGYEAMRLVLDAVATAGPDRSAIIDQLASMPVRQSVLGSYRFDAFGDTTLKAYGVYRIRGRALEYAATVQAP